MRQHGKTATMLLVLPAVVGMLVEAYVWPGTLRYSQTPPAHTVVRTFDNRESPANQLSYPQRAQVEILIDDAERAYAVERILTVERLRQQRAGEVLRFAEARVHLTNNERSDLRSLVLPAVDQLSRSGIAFDETDVLRSYRVKKKLCTVLSGKKCIRLIKAL